MPDFDGMGSITVIEAYPLENPQLREKGYFAALDDEIVVVARNFPTWLEKLADDGEIAVSKAPDGVRKPFSSAEVDTYAGQVCLFLDEQPFGDLIVERADTGNGDNLDFENKAFYQRKGNPDTFTVLTFRLKKTTQNSGQWLDLLRGKGIRDRPTDLTVGFYKLGARGSNPHMASALNPKGIEADNSPQELFSIRTAVVWKLWAGASAMLAIVGVCFYFGHQTDLLRDPTSPVNPTGRYPFSLGLCQMAFWTIVILASFIFLFIILEDFQTVSPAAVTLMGISAVTGLSSVLINKSNQAAMEDKWRGVPSFASKRNLLKQLADAKRTLEETVNKLAQADLPVGATGKLTLSADDLALLQTTKVERSAFIDKVTPLLRYYGFRAAVKSFAMDLLKETDSVSFHRLQLIIWTLVLGGVFLYNVFVNLIMPDYSASLLILVGISSGTYIGFKMPAAASEA